MLCLIIIYYITYNAQTCKTRINQQFSTPIPEYVRIKKGQNLNITLVRSDVNAVFSLLQNSHKSLSNDFIICTYIIYLRMYKYVDFSNLDLSTDKKHRSNGKSFVWRIAICWIDRVMKSPRWRHGDCMNCPMTNSFYRNHFCD